MIVAGVMSGTSADGINVALVRVSSDHETLAHRDRGEAGVLAHHRASSRRKPFADARDARLSIALLAHQEFPFPAPVRRHILEAMNAESISVASLARLSFLLGKLYAEAVAKTASRHRIRLELVGCHGQTLYHQGTPAPFLGRKLAVTWQTGEAAIVAARLRVPVVSDFRPADMAAGGKGAPLVPFLDYILYRDARIGRIAQNIGGIANLTAIPAGSTPREILAFDTGPGNMVIDAVVQQLFGKSYDRDGRIAASGWPHEDVIRQLMTSPFFRQRPPRTAGREEFGREYASSFLKLCRGASKPDAVATATALTAQSIAGAIERFILQKNRPSRPRRRKENYRELIVSGGGAKNPTLLTMLRHELAPLQIELRFSSEFGIPTEAKEAVAFAALAHETWHHRPSNISAATGARRPAILGKISYA